MDKIKWCKRFDCIAHNAPLYFATKAKTPKYANNGSSDNKVKTHKLLKIESELHSFRQICISHFYLPYYFLEAKFSNFIK